MAFDFTNFATFHANKRSLSSSSVGTRFVTTFISCFLSIPSSFDCHKIPPEIFLRVPGYGSSFLRLALRTLTLGFDSKAFKAPSSKSVATIISKNWFSIIVFATF